MPLDHEAEYNNRARVRNSSEIIARWAALSSAALAEMGGERDIAYGPEPRNAFDLFPGKGTGAKPLIAYIHGGYWQRGDRKEYAFVARALTARGYDVALPSYSLCPDVTVGDIAAEMELFVAALWRKTGRRPVVVGHSAGGHLAAMVMTTPKASGIPADVVRAACGLSGVYDLPPLIPTSLNVALKLDPHEARRQSPMFGPKPSHDCRFIAAVGAQESPEFLRQARDFADAWSSPDVITENYPVPAADHFTIVDELCRADSVLAAKVAALTEA